jgi:hypothetical protein
MEKFVKMVSVLGIGVALLAAGVVPGLAEEQTVRARLGVLVKSGDQMLRAKGNNRLKAGDQLRIYVVPEQSFYIYVVHADQKSVALLKMVEGKIEGFPLVLPSRHEFYEVDGESPVETFTIICSPDELKEISAILSSQAPREKWTPLERELLQRGAVDLSQTPEKPFAIAGNVRGGEDANAGDPFLRELQIFSGKSILVKQYEFSVKK